MIKFRCNHCRQKIGVPEAYAGRRVKCNGCGGVLSVPAASDLSAETGGGSVVGEEMMSLLKGLGAGAAPPADAPAATPDTKTPGSKKPADRPTDGEPVTMPVPAADRARVIAHWALIGIVVVGVAGLLLGNIMTKIFFAVVVLTAVNGYWLGAKKVAAAFGGLLAAALLGAPMGRGLEGIFSSILGTTGLTNRLISVAIVSAIIVAAVAAALHFAVARLSRDHPEWKPFDRGMGLGMGTLEGLLVGLLIIWSVLVLEPVAATSLQASPDNKVAAQVVRLAEAARESVVGRLAGAVNPLDDMRLFGLFQKALVVLNDPDARTEFLRDPAMERVQNMSSVEQALDRFSKDPEIARITQEEGQITAGQLKKLLDSPTVLEILDETGVVEDLTPIADEIEKAIDAALEKTGQRIEEAAKPPAEREPDGP
ncbi:MAG: hypothetical protein CMJ18_10810 [Phycisphaeraceae bacterium]|nr:hypothetical protein [Phycisphaeraceae bacterium]